MKKNQTLHPVFLKTGFTTGTYACAASVAALESLLNDTEIQSVGIELPNGQFHSFDCFIKNRTKSSVTVSVIKDAGDDVDVTDGLEILSTVEFQENPGIEITAGEGIGKCVKKGLAISVGEPAINPIPRINILGNLKRALIRNNRKNEGIKVTLSIPNGKEIAKNTFNPKLGIVDGLSILGTTGIVKPMSKEAIIKTIFYELKQVLSQNSEKVVVLVPGNYGNEFALELNINKDLIVQVSNFIGDSLDISKELGFKKILLIGDIGKLVKVAGGIFQTHSRVADGRMEILAANLAAIGASTEIVNQVLNSTTTKQVIELIKGTQLEEIYLILANKIKNRIKDRSNLDIEVILFSNGEGILSKTISDDDLMFFMK